MVKPSGSAANQDGNRDSGQKELQQKTELLSLLVSYPKQWVEKLVDGVGTASLKGAKLAAELSAAGAEFVVCDETQRNRRFGPKEGYLIDWLK